MKRSVLVVEDNRELAENIAELFEELGASCRIFSRAEPAVAHARELGFDLAIVDVRLPDVASGVELVPRLRKIVPSAEVVLMTGGATVDTAIEAVRHGAFAYVQKPFNPDELMTLGERALTQVALRREREGLARDLAASEAVYRGIVDNVEALIFGIDSQNKITLANRFACRVLERPDSELLGEPLVSLGAGDVDRDLLDKALRAADVGQRVAEQEVTLTSAGDDDCVVRLTITPLQPRGEAPFVLLAVGLDVTHRVELERRAAENEALAVMGTLTTGLAHEIRNPLNAAKLQLELLARWAAKLEDADRMRRAVERVDIVKSELARLATMLEDFLALARPTRLALRPCEVFDLFEEVIRFEAPALDEAGVQVGVCCPEGPTTVYADSDRIRQVLMNLIRNAVDAMREQGGGRIMLSARRNGELAELSVIDTGPGVVSASALVYEPFFTTKEAGTGLGLSIVKKIVELHGPGVELDDHEEGGAIARFTLPIR